MIARTNTARPAKAGTQEPQVEASAARGPGFPPSRERADRKRLVGIALSVLCLATASLLRKPPIPSARSESSIRSPAGSRSTSWAPHRQET